jgi:hypothetical protein
MDALAAAPHHAPVRVLPHIKRLDDGFGDFLVRITCPCGASRHIEPEALPRIAGKSGTNAFGSGPLSSGLGATCLTLIALTSR